MKPTLLIADNEGNIHDDPDLLMMINRCGQWTLPEKDDLIPLPEESELFLLPGRTPIGLDTGSGEAVASDGYAVAAFSAPGYTLSAHPAYLTKADAPILPLFAYGAVGYAQERFWLAASKVDDDPRQQFANISAAKIDKECRKILSIFPKNRLIRHIINNCVRRYTCPAARNFALGRYEAPLPTSSSCNAQCLGCISSQSKDSPILTTPQCRMSFIPSRNEIVEVMEYHASREKHQPVFSFGQGCEGDPLMNAPLLIESIAAYRAGKKGGHGTINCNCNGSKPQVMADLAHAGLTSIRVSLNSCQPRLYEAYYRPINYTFEDVKKSLALAREHGVFASLNLLYFPGVTDTWNEIEALVQLCRDAGVAMIQLRNLNIDPAWYPEQLGIKPSNTAWEPALGLRKFMKEVKKRCPWLRFGYFNPYLGDTAVLPQIDA